ncbi:310_t:CDS:1, partial [Funneliformis mosseae]
IQNHLNLKTACVLLCLKAGFLKNCEVNENNQLDSSDIDNDKIDE